jgi:transposase
MRFLALDVHRDFCEVAIKERGELRSAGRVKTAVEELELFARSLGREDQVALEASGPANAVARILAPHVGRVVIANPLRLRAIAEAKVKTDKLDARTLCELLAAGFLPAVWRPDERTRALRRWLSRRERLVRSRTRAKNEVHAVLQRNLKGRPPASDAFGRRGRRWLGSLELATDERATVDGCLREIDFLSAEIAAIERELARLGLDSAELRRLMSVPGVSLVSALTFLAVVGDIRRFETAKRLVSYVGLDPRVRQSGEAPARHGRISKQGSGAARHMLCEAAWIVVRTPGPLRAFFERLRARRGEQKALVATARKLCVLFWQLLVTEQDYAFGRPSLTRHKLRRLELMAGDPPRRGQRSGSQASKREQLHERELSEQFEQAYRRLVADWQQRPKKRGAGATPGRASSRPSRRQAARQGSVPDPAL